MSFLDDIVERNRAFVQGRAPKPLAPVETLRLAVVACYDPRLDELFHPALGYPAGRTFLLRTAGALVQPSGATLRSLTMAVYMFGVTEVLVVGHTSCRMAQFQATEFIDTFRRRGVAREAFGPNDLREWAGAIPSPRRGVQISVGNILAAPFLPRDVAVAGVVLDDETGALEVVVRPGEAIVTMAAPAEVPATGQSAEAPAAEPPPAAAAAAAAAAEAELPTEGEVAGLTADVREFARLLGSKQRWRDDLKTLQARARPPAPPAGQVPHAREHRAARGRRVAGSARRVREGQALGDHGPEEPRDRGPVSSLPARRGEAEMSIGVIYVGLLVLGLSYAVISGALGWLADLGGGDVHVDAGGPPRRRPHAPDLRARPWPPSSPASAAAAPSAHYLLHWPLLGSLRHRRCSSGSPSPAPRSACSS